MTTYKAIISDIDGTLVPVSPHGVPTQKVITAINELQKKGYFFTLASGRPYFLIEKLVHILGLKSPIIADNGAALIDPTTGKAIWESTIEHTKANAILEMVKDCKLYHISAENFPPDVNNPQNVDSQFKIRKVSIHNLLPEEIEALKLRISNKFPEMYFVRVASYRGKEYGDLFISEKSATKEHAVIEFARILNINTSEIIGIGDGNNDIEMLKVCGLKVAMRESVPELLKMADYIAPSVDEDGLAEVINRFFDSTKI